MYATTIVATLLAATAGVSAAPSMKERATRSITVDFYNSTDPSCSKNDSFKKNWIISVGAGQAGCVNSTFGTGVIQGTFLDTNQLTAGCYVRFYNKASCPNTGSNYFDITSSSPVATTGCHTQDVESYYVSCP